MLPCESGSEVRNVGGRGMSFSLDTANIGRVESVQGPKKIWRRFFFSYGTPTKSQAGNALPNSQKEQLEDGEDGRSLVVVEDVRQEWKKGGQLCRRSKIKQDVCGQERSFRFS